MTIVAGVVLGKGGLGVQSANAAAAAVQAAKHVHVIARGRDAASTPALENSDIDWLFGPLSPPEWRARFGPLRWRHGKLQYRRDATLGRWAQTKIEETRPSACYVFTQVGLETLTWAKATDLPAVLESPNGHIRTFREILVREARDLCGECFHGHPTEQMLSRVEQEYRLASIIRVASEWSRRSLVAGGVPDDKVHVIGQPVDLQKFAPVGQSSSNSGPLRICFVGSLDLRKGFVYLLRAMRRAGKARFRLRIVGSTGDRQCRRLFARESEDLMVEAHAEDPRSALGEAEVFVLPSLEDGSPFALAEAMACGVPVIVTDQCGNADWVVRGSGWVVPARDVDALADSLNQAFRERRHLTKMGSVARLSAVTNGGAERLTEARDWLRKFVATNPRKASV